MLRIILPSVLSTPQNDSGVLLDDTTGEVTSVNPAERIRITSSVPICLLRSSRKTDCCLTP